MFIKWSCFLYQYLVKHRLNLVEFKCDLSESNVYNFNHKHCQIISLMSFSCLHNKPYFSMKLTSYTFSCSCKTISHNIPGFICHPFSSFISNLLSYSQSYFVISAQPIIGFLSINIHQTMAAVGAFDNALHWSVTQTRWWSPCYQVPRVKLTPSALSPLPYQDHSKCAHQAVKWKPLMAPLSASKNSLPFPLCAPFIGILKAIKYDNSAISSRLNFTVIALNQLYFVLRGLFFSPHGVHMDSDALAHITLVMRGRWSPLGWHSDPN